MKQTGKPAEDLIREVARGALSYGKVLEFIGWTLREFPKPHEQKICTRIFFEELQKWEKAQPEQLFLFR